MGTATATATRSIDRIGESQRRGGEAGAPSTTVAWLVLLAFSLVVTCHATGACGQLLYPVVCLGSSVAAYLGLRRHRPARRRPWRILIAVGILWTLAGVARAETHATGDLTPARSLWPDAFALPGYVLFGIALFGLVRGRSTQRDLGALIDGIMVALGTTAVVFATVVAPTLRMEGTWIWARLAVAVYPAVSMWMLIGVVQLTLTRRTRRTGGTVLLVAGCASLLLGDVTFALGEIGSLRLPSNVLDVPYLLVAACLGSAALHPGVHHLVEARLAESTRFEIARFFAVAVALTAPVVAMTASADVGPGRSIQLGLLALTTVFAVARITTSARAENEAHTELLRRATHDQLTGLPARELLMRRVEQLLASPERGRVAVMFLDLDEFKLVNDSLGHAAGDVLLREMASRLRATVRADDVVGRIGGDEFVIVTAGLDEVGVRAMGDRLRRAIRDPFSLAGDEVVVSTSVGITIAEPGSTPQELMQDADMAMYRSKERGRNHVTLFDSTMRDSVARRVELESGLRKALELDEVSVVYQPVVDLATSRVEGVEALMRWTTPECSYSPAEFMTVAEDSGLIVSLGTYVLDEACRQLSRWRRTVPGASDLTMSVNVSVRQMQTSNLVDVVADVLERHGLPGEALWLEITESVMLDDTVTTAAVMSGLHQLGVRLAVDDFGTGFSSLSYLRTFPVSRVKIDRSFVTDVWTDTTSEALVRAVVGIGRSLQLQVVAEGVETMEQAQMLRALGCERQQGYLYARPGPPAELVDRLGTIDLGWSSPLPRRTRTCARTPA